jgi:hypothetical protein
MISKKRRFFMKKKSIKLLTALLLLMSFMLTGGIFAYWAVSVQGDELDSTTEITIGSGCEATTTLDLVEEEKTQGNLVPAGYEEVGSVSEIVVTYSVTLLADEGAEGAEATLTVTYGTLPSDLINVEIELSSTTIIAGGSTVTVTVTITLTEPADEEEYNEVADLEFDLDLTFTATI